MKFGIPKMLVPKISSFKLARDPHFNIPGICKRSLIDWTAIISIALYLIGCGILFFTLVQPEFNGNSTIRLGADSDTYFQIANNIRSNSFASSGVVFVSLGGNLLGPVLLALALKTAFWVALFNLFLFVLSILIASRIPGVNPWLFAIFLAANAETSVSIITLNKEIFALFALVLFAYYIYSSKRSLVILLIVLLVSLFARWEQSAIVILFLILSRKRSYFFTRPKLAVSLIVIGLSLAYPLMLHSTDVDLSGFTSQAEGGNTIVVLNTLQSHYAYVLAVFPKIFMNILGRLVSPSYFFSQYWTEDFSDFQNRYAIHLHEIAMLVICIAILVTKKWTLKHPIPFFVAIYLVVTSINPFIQPRYEYPVYVFLCLELARKKMKSAVPGVFEDCDLSKVQHNS